MQLELGINPPGCLFEALTWTIEHRDCAPATRSQHLDHRRWLCDYFGSARNVETIGYNEVRKYIDDEVRRGIMRVSIKKRLVTLRMGLEDAFRRGMRKTSTEWWPEIKSDSKPGQDLWSHEQWRVGRLAFEAPQRIGIDCLFWTAMHTSDVRRWRRSDVDLVRKLWRRYNTKSKVDPTWLPLPDEFAAILEEWFTVAQITAPNHLVCPDFWVSPIKPMARACLRADLPRITPLGLRRSCVSYMFEIGIQKGQPADTISQFCALWLGHKGDPRTSDIIRRHYLRWSTETIRAASPF